MTGTPSADDMELAACWLECYDEESEQFEAAARVAKWLRAKAVKKAEAEVIRDHARKHGVTVARVRAALKTIREGKAK